MLFWILGILVIMVIVLWVVAVILDSCILKEAAISVSFISAFFVLFFLIGFSKKTINYHINFKTEYKVVLYSEIEEKAKKDRIREESIKLEESLKSLDNYALKDREILANIIAEISAVENDVLNKKISLYEKILKHNASCNFWWGGKWVVDINDYPLLKVKE